MVDLLCSTCQIASTERFRGIRRATSSEAGVSLLLLGFIGHSRPVSRGADSIVVSGGYPDDADYGDEIIYTGHGGRDPDASIGSVAAGCAQPPPPTAQVGVATGSSSSRCPTGARFGDRGQENNAATSPSRSGSRFLGAPVIRSTPARVRSGAPWQAVGATLPSRRGAEGRPGIGTTPVAPQ